MTIIDPTTAGPGYLIRYTPRGAPVLNDPRILEALRYALAGEGRLHLSTTDNGTRFHVALYEEVTEWHGVADTMTLAVRRMLGDYFADWGLIDYAYRFGRVVDQWSGADEEALAVLDRFADGAPCQ